MGAFFQITLENLLVADSNISVVLNKEKLKDIYILIKSQFGSVKEFAKEIDVNPQSLYNWLNGLRNPKLTNVIRICRLLNIEHKDIIEKVISLNEPFGSFIPIAAFPIKGDINLSSLLGHSLGDGHIGISFEYTNRCENLLDEVKESVSRLPIKNVRIIHNLQPNKAPTLVFPKLVRNILVCAGSPIGNKITGNFNLPLWIINGTKEIKAAFLRALFDDEGNVSSNRTIRLSLSKRIDLNNNLQEFLEEMILMLEKLGIKKIKLNKQKGENGKNGETIENTLTIFGFRNFEIFYKIIKFSHPKKMESLRNIVENTKIIRNRAGETKENIIKTLNNGSLTISNVSQKVGTSWKTTWEHLKDLESKNLVHRNKVYGSRESFWSVNHDIAKR